MADIQISSHEWLLQEDSFDEDVALPLKLSTITAEFNTALNLAVEFKERIFIDKVIERRELYISDPPEVKNIVNAIWVAHFGEESYEGYIDPSVVLQWGERTGAKPIMSLDIAVQPLLDWAEGHDCPDDIVTPVKRSLEKHART
jgi:hypothetical protein